MSSAARILQLRRWPQLDLQFSHFGPGGRFSPFVKAGQGVHRSLALSQFRPTQA